MSIKAELALKSALISTGLVQPVDSKIRKNRIEVLCRQVPGQEKAWLDVVASILQVAEEKGVSVHLCRRYVHRKGQMVFGWHVQVDSEKIKGLQAATDTVVQVLLAAKPELQPATPRAQPMTPQPAPEAPVRGRPLAPGQHPAPRQAAPRLPEGGPGTVDPRPVEDYRVRVVQRTVGHDGKETIIEEMPLPHIHRELNVPTKPVWDEKLNRLVGGSRGAKFSGG